MLLKFIMLLVIGTIILIGAGLIWLMVGGETKEIRHNHITSFLVTLFSTFTGVFAAAQIANYYDEKRDRSIMHGLIRQAHAESSHLSCHLLRSVRRFNSMDVKRPRLLPELKNIDYPKALTLLLETETFPRIFYGKIQGLPVTLYNISYIYNDIRSKTGEDKIYISSRLAGYARSLLQGELLLELMDEDLSGQISSSELKEKSFQSSLRARARAIEKDVLTNKSSRRCDQDGGFFQIKTWTRRSYGLDPLFSR